MKILRASELQSVFGGQACDPFFSLGPGEGCTTAAPDGNYVVEASITSPAGDASYLGVWCDGILQRDGFGFGPGANTFVCRLGGVLVIYNAKNAKSTVRGTVLTNKIIN